MIPIADVNAFTVTATLVAWLVLSGMVAVSVRRSKDKMTEGAYEVMRTFSISWTLLLLVVGIGFLRVEKIAQDGKDTADALLVLRADSVPKTNRTIASVCTVVRTLAAGQRSSLDPKVLSLFIPPETQKTKLFRELIAQAQMRVDILDQAVENLTCAQIKANP